ncbi:MAG: DNA-directed RNA polymerase subunit omega, partial [Clostridiales Family XIII bacterium]|nr:DNA-directed RNA polymerase subunit omega [Clostridiales Family XIII bacterium]
DDLDDKAENRYQLTMFIARRAKDIADGYPVFTNKYEDIPVLAASDEIDKGLITYKKKEKFLTNEKDPIV